MRIACKYCHYEYDYELYGESCPQCGTQNQPFRSSAARLAMGLEEPGSRFFPIDRREDAARAGDPMYGKSTLRRLRPYLFVLILAFSVVALGQGLMRLSNQAERQRAASSATAGVRPPILELADAAYDESFTTAGGWRLRVNAAGWVQDQPVAEEQWLFVDFLLLAEDRKLTEKNSFVPPVAAAGEAVALPEQLPGAGRAALYTPLDAEVIGTGEPGVSGQLFYLLPKDTRTLTLFYQQAGERQSMVLELPAQKDENGN